VFAAVFVWKDREKANIIIKIILSISVIAYLLFIGRDIYKDIFFIVKDKYLITECNTSTLQEIYHRKQHYTYEISTIEKINNKRQLNIEMDFYQYNELKGKFGGNSNKIITVWYLPNTKRMLKYE
jgi:hypothetical protein